MDDNSGKKLFFLTPLAVFLLAIDKPFVLDIKPPSVGVFICQNLPNFFAG